MTQLSFLLPLEEDLNEENFLQLAENKIAFEALKKFFAQKDFSTSHFPSLIIKGANASGKSHLLKVFAKKFNAEFIDSIINFSKNHFYILENIDEIKNEELVLNLVNSASEANAFLILTKKNSEFKLKDLASRLKNIPVATILEPSLDSIKQLLINQFSRKQIKLSRPIIDFLANNINRDYDAILAAVKKVEFYFSENQKKLTLKELRNLF